MKLQTQNKPELPPSFRGEDLEILNQEARIGAILFIVVTATILFAIVQFIARSGGATC